MFTWCTLRGLLLRPEELRWAHPLFVFLKREPSDWKVSPSLPSTHTACWSRNPDQSCRDRAVGILCIREGFTLIGRLLFTVEDTLLLQNTSTSLKFIKASFLPSSLCTMTNVCWQREISNTPPLWQSLGFVCF